jgi:hypothetical protein
MKEVAFPDFAVRRPGRKGRATESI